MTFHPPNLGDNYFPKSYIRELSGYSWPLPLLGVNITSMYAIIHSNFISIVLDKIMLIFFICSFIRSTTLPSPLQDFSIASNEGEKNKRKNPVDRTNLQDFQNFSRSTKPNA